MVSLVTKNGERLVIVAPPGIQISHARALDNPSPGASLDLVNVAHTTVTGVATRVGGSATHTLTVAELPAHQHDISHSHTVGSVHGVGLVGGLATGLGVPRTTATSGTSPMISGAAGGGQPHNKHAAVFRDYLHDLCGRLTRGPPYGGGDFCGF